LCRQNEKNDKMKKIISEFHDGLKLKTIKIAAAIILIYSAFGLLYSLFVGSFVLITGQNWNSIRPDALTNLYPVLAVSAVGLFIGRLLYKSKISNRMIINLEPLVNVSSLYRADLKNLKSNIDASSFLINALCFSAPAWGIIMFLTQNDKYPKRTKAAIKFAKRGLILYGIIALISILISLSILATI
jgi:lysylphosphatidylglycerol synthetase-like protein (DUF2156 family)